MTESLTSISKTDKYERGRLQRRILDLMLILLDGRSHSFDALLHTLGKEHDVCEKTIQRDLANLLRLERLQLRKFTYDEQVFYRAQAVIIRRSAVPEFKKCSYCQEKKPCNRENFHKQSASPDGFRPVCIPCQIDYNRRWRHANPYSTEQQKIYRRRWLTKKESKTKKAAGA